MRQLETFSAEAEARALADAMYADGIETTVSATREGAHALWVHDDARLDDARALLSLFRSSPNDPKFVESAKVAKARRRASEQKDREAEKRIARARRDTERRSGMGMASLFFVLASVGVYAMAQVMDTSGLISAIAFVGPDATSTFDSIARGEVWRLVTPMFIPRNPLSLFFSSIFLLALGSAFEQRHPSRAMILLTLVSSAAANAFVAFMMGPGAAFSTNGVTAAIFAYLYVRHRIDPMSWDVPPYGTTFWIPLWFVVGIVIESYRPMTYMDLAGFVVGGIYAFFAARR